MSVLYRNKEEAMPFNFKKESKEVRGQQAQDGGAASSQESVAKEGTCISSTLQCM